MYTYRTADWHIITFVSNIVLRIYCYALLTIFTWSGFVIFCSTVAVTPLMLVSRKFYREACRIVQYLLVPGILCVPFSWCGVKLHSNGFGRLKEFKGKNLLLLSNHSARIDWIIGQYIGRAYGERVGFITEAFIMMLPVFGWTRYLFGDMFVFRSFKRDKERLEKNITSFHKTNSRRWIFLCPEGHIADFNPTDQKYIEECEGFSREWGLEPFKMLLTPRYKGMQIFNKLMTRGDPNVKPIHLSVTMTYCQNGELLIKPLKSKDRVVPDLWSLVTGNLQVYTHLHMLELSNDPEVIKDQLMQDYALKDKLLRQFYLKGNFPAAHPDYSVKESPDNWKPKPDPALPSISEKDIFRLQSNKLTPQEQREAENGTFSETSEGSVYQTLRPDHGFMNISLFVQLFGSVYLFYYFGWASAMKYVFFGLYSLLAVSHITGEFLANGQSRESIPLEGLIKGLMFRYLGIEGDKAEDAVKASNSEEENEEFFPSKVE